MNQERYIDKRVKYMVQCLGWSNGLLMKEETEIGALLVGTPQQWERFYDQVNLGATLLRYEARDLRRILNAQK